MLDLDKLGGPHQYLVAMGLYQGQGGPSMLDAWPSHTVLKLAFSGMALLPDHSAMTNNNFCVSSSSHTQHALSLLYRKGS
jgi:hypothetical protein